MKIKGIRRIVRKAAESLELLDFSCNKLRRFGSWKHFEEYKYLFDDSLGRYSCWLEYQCLDFTDEEKYNLRVLLLLLFGEVMS